MSQRSKSFMFIVIGIIAFLVFNFLSERVGSNLAEVLFSMLGWFGLGMGIAGLLTLFIKKKQ